MQKQFNDQQQSFVDSMSRAFQDAVTQLSTTYRVLAAFAIFVALIFLIYLIRSRWTFIHGRVVYLRRKMKGLAVVTDRVPKKLQITLHVPFGAESSYRTSTFNLSPNGFFVKMNPPLKKAQIFKFILYLQGEDKITSYAQVVWVQERWSEHHPTGIGCKFLELTPEEKNKIKLVLRNQSYDALISSTKTKTIEALQKFRHLK